MQYQQAHFEHDGRVYSLADEVWQHLVKIVLTEQAEHEKTTGNKAPEPRMRPTLKRKRDDSA